MKKINFRILKKVRCCIPLCDEPAHVVGLYDRVNVPLCILHLSYFQSGDIVFETGTEGNITVIWNDLVQQAIKEKEMERKNG